MQAAVRINQASCRCVEPSHERRCALALVVAERGRLYEGLYDTRAPRRAPPPQTGRVILLNPENADSDPASRRFALLEID